MFSSIPHLAQTKKSNNQKTKSPDNQTTKSPIPEKYFEKSRKPLGEKNGEESAHDEERPQRHLALHFFFLERDKENSRQGAESESEEERRENIRPSDDESQEKREKPVAHPHPFLPRNRSDEEER